MIRSYLFILTIFAVQTLSAQEVFQRSYGGYGSDYGRAVIECSDGGYLVVGSTNSFDNESTDIYLLRVDEIGEYLWGKNIGLPDYIEWGVDLIEDSEGNFTLAGYTDATPSGTYDGILVKTDHSGNVIWKKTYGGNDWDFFESMALTPEGNIVVVGQKTLDGNPEGWILMTDPNGTIIWETLIPGNGKLKLTGVDVCPSGVIVFTGYTENTLLDTKTQISGSLNLDGAIIWASTYPDLGKVETGRCVCGIPSRIYSAGTLYSEGGISDILFSALNVESGMFVWQKSLGQVKGFGLGIMQKDDGGVFIAGSLFGIGFNDYSASINSYDSNGNDLPAGNTAILGGNGVDIFYDIKPTADNGLIAVGKTSSFGNNFQVLLCKIDANGIYTPNNTDYLDTSTKIQSLSKPTPFNIFPNPAKSAIKVELEITDRVDYQILDLTGKTISWGSMSLGEQTINIGKLKAGFYFIRIETSNKDIFLSRFVKID